MKKHVLFAAMLLTLTVPSLAWSQNGPMGAGGPPSQGAGGPPPQPPGGEHRGNGPEFQERKAEILKRMNERLAEVQQRIACVQAASNREAMRACMPERREHDHDQDHDHGDNK